MSKSEAVRAIERKYRAQSRRRAKLISLIVLGVGIPLMSLASWWIVHNYRLVHDPRDGSTRWMSVEEVEAKRLAGERAKRAAAPPPRVRIVEVPTKRSPAVRVQAAQEPAEIVVAIEEPQDDQKVVEFFGIVETEGTLQEHDRRTGRDRGSYVERNK